MEEKSASIVALSRSVVLVLFFHGNNIRSANYHTSDDWEL
jgi:hypothetical protein